MVWWNAMGLPTVLRIFRAMARIVQEQLVVRSMGLPRVQLYMP